MFMRKCFLIWLFLSGNIFHNPAYTQVLPSVEKMLGNAEQLKNNKPAEAYRIASHALEISMKTSHQPSVALVQRYLGVLCFMMGKPEEARLHFDTSFRLYTILNDELGIGYCLNNLGVIYQETGEYDKAVSCYEKSIKIKLKHGDTAGASGGMLNTGTIYSYMGEYLKAIRTFRKVIVIARQSHDTTRLIDAGINLATVYINEKRMDSALILLENVYKLSEETGDNYSLAYCLNNMGEIYRSRLLDSMAIRCFNRALAIRGDIDDVAGQATTLNNLGQVYLRQNKAGLAIDCYFQALKYNQQLNDNRSTAITMNSIGELLLKQGDAEGAAAYLRSAVAIAVRLNLKQEIREIYINLILCYGVLRHFDSARRCLSLFNFSYSDSGQVRSMNPGSKASTASIPAPLKHSGWKFQHILLALTGFFSMIYFFTGQYRRNRY